ncbi:MAG TPA: DUF1353 domain-containing protein [Pyrinomonadaceae bacterium]|jgi:hypothetical protein
MNIEKLQAQLNDIDKLYKEGSVEATISGEPGSPFSLVVSATNPPAVESVDENAAPIESLLNVVNLNTIAVPQDFIDDAVDRIFSNPNPGGDLPGIKVMQIGATKDYVVVEDYAYHADAGYDITVLKDFKYDRASIPRIFWAIIDKDDLSNVAPVFHDLLYRHGGVLPPDEVPLEGTVSPSREFVRADVDKLFRELAKKCGVSSWRAQLAYEAVSKFGGPSWKPHH